MSKKKKDAEEPTKDNTKRVKFNSSLKVPLTADEIADRADRAAAMIADRDSKEDELKHHSKHAKSVIEQIDTEMRRIQGEVRTKSTYKMVECERQYVFNEGEYREVRLDTGEVTMTRKLLESERQMELPFVDPEEDAVEVPPQDESWRLVPIAEAMPNLGKRIMDAFEKAKIETMGCFSDFCAKHGEFWVKDMPGIGGESENKIIEAQDAFWKSRTK